MADSYAPSDNFGIGDSGAGPIYIGVGYGLIAPSGTPAKTQPDREYVAGQRGIVRQSAKRGLPQSIDSLTRQFGWQVYDAILCDPIALGAFNILRLGILGSKMTLPPTHPKLLPTDPDTPETSRSKQIAEFSDRLTASFDRPFVAFLWEALEALAYGNKLAEKVYRLCDVGEDKGKYLFSKLKFKPRWTWLFVVDGCFNQLGIMAWTADEIGVVVLPREKFAIFTVGDRDGDPRGTSILRAAYEAWNDKVLTWPSYTKFRHRFASPKPIGKTAEGVRSVQPTDPKTGKPILGVTPITPQEDLVDALSSWADEDVAIAVPAGTEIDLLESQSDGAVYREAIELFNREIAHAILNNARTTLEAEHGSKADGQIAQDVTGMSIRFYRRILADFVRREILLPAVELNFGKEDAHLYTPTPSFADVEQQDFDAMAGAFAQLKTAGLLPDELIPVALERLGLPIPGTLTFSDREADEDDAADEAARDEKEDQKKAKSRNNE